MNYLYILPFLLLGVKSQSAVFSPLTTLPSLSPAHVAAPTGYSYDPMRGFYISGDGGMSGGMPLTGGLTRGFGAGLRLVTLDGSVPGPGSIIYRVAEGQRGGEVPRGTALSSGIDGTIPTPTVARISHLTRSTMLTSGIGGTIPGIAALPGPGLTHTVVGAGGAVANTPGGAVISSAIRETARGYMPGGTGGMPRMTMIGGEPGYMAIRTGLPMYGGQGQLPLI